jgi:hypothetical protein
MTCPQCNTQNAEQAKNCEFCSTPLVGVLAADRDPAPQYQPGENIATTYQSTVQEKEQSSMNQKENKISKIGKIMGIVVGCITLVGLIPCLGWLNWFNLIFGGITNILCWVGVFTEGKENPQAKTDAVIGLIISFVAFLVGSVRLLLGAGCF